MWLEVMKDGVTDPKKGVHYDTYVRKNSAIGFSKCDDCDNLAKDIAQARTPEERECFERQLAAHHQQVKEDRMELARIARLCKLDKRHVGFMIDAVDKQKFQIPTTASASKSLKKLKRIIQKITGVEWFVSHSLTHTLNTHTDPRALSVTHSHSGFITH